MSQETSLPSQSDNIDDVQKVEPKTIRTIVEENKQWESFFDPQYTFGSFQTGISKPDQFKEKWHTASDNIPSTSPTLPNIKQLQQHINTIDTQDDTYKILPRPFPAYNKNTEPTLCKDRLQLLNIIQTIGFNKEKDITQAELSTTARLQLQWKQKTDQIKQDILLDSKQDDGLTKELDRLSTNDLSLDDMYQNISFSQSKNLVVEQDNVKRRKNRVSFLYFAFGFMFPPLWLIGALYVPKHHQTEASKDIDKKWKVYSRNAFFMFLLLLVITSVLIIILKPETIGFRNSLEGGYNADRVVFDEEDVVTSK
ncbi:hypothetical protein BDF21DRAFT_455648 [Thamnidium elegans]|uniref:Uncharacterized protein n=1 Tax=Thamnidium elegans TaxID=101142 RepID=A0A8H7SVD1_9FUNG|nr:hypothetical protein INT48_006536 [Thamnidium elegans]KAI8061272.1 hypothetical protein BDF21DRAFT_455648 [Thamnidium elegans]